MKIQQNVENGEFRIELSVQTIERISHKLVSESPELTVQIRDIMASAGERMLELLHEELDNKFPWGIK